MSRARWIALILLSAALLPQLASFGYDFVDFDDRAQILRERSLRSVWDPAAQRSQEYMPLTDTSYMLDVALLGTHASSFRPQQWLWYAASVLLLWGWLQALAKRLQLPEALAPVAALLFALHPAHVESVTWLMGRKDLLCGALMFACLWLALSLSAARLIACVLAAWLAMLAKPVAVTLPLVLLGQAWLLRADRRRSAVLIAAVAGAAGLVVYAYQLRVGALSTGIGDQEPWRIYHGPAWLRWGQQLAWFLRMALAPLGLVPLVDPRVMDTGWRSPGGLAGLFILLVYAGMATYALVRRHILALAALLFIAPLLLILVAPPWHQYLAGRYLHVPVAGVCIALAYVFAQTRRRLLLVAPMALLWSVGFIAYSYLWRDDLALWSGSAERDPAFAELSARASNAALHHGDKPQALHWLERCWKLDPGHPQCGAQLGELLLPIEPGGAQALLQASLARDVTGDAHRVLALHWAARGQAAEGAALYKAWLAKHHVGPHHLAPMIQLAAQAGDLGLTFKATLKLLESMANEAPEAAPPLPLLRKLAAQSGDQTLIARIESAAHTCPDVRCFQRAFARPQAATP
jgi:protein O-mannosyl-transferase